MEPTGDGRTAALTAALPARAALAGNPSDGHGGAVLAVPVPAMSATARLSIGNGFSVADATPGDDLWELVAASCRAASRLAGVPTSILGSIHAEITTTIPRSVGLAGSSAIVIAVLQCLGRLGRSGRLRTGISDEATPWADRLADPAMLAVIAQSAEVDELGTPAGLQDRLVQAHGRPVLMEFGPDRTGAVLGRPCGSVTPLPRPPGRFVLAHRTTAAEPSGVVHRGLADRRGADRTVAIMVALAETARLGAAAVRDGDLDRLGATMDRTFELRNELLELDPRHVEMVEVARSAGGHANYTGSGGAIIVCCPDAPTQATAAARLGGLPDCDVILDPLDPLDPPVPTDAIRAP